MKKAIFIILLSFTLLHAGQYISPGIKIGYEFLDLKGLIVGFELSYSRINSSYFYYGIVLGTNYNASQKRIEPYSEVEVGILVIGAALGIEYSEGFKVRGRAFLGAGVPFLSCATAFNDREVALEVAGLFKFPFNIDNDPFTWPKLDFYIE